MEQTRFGAHQEPVEGARESTRSMSVPAPGAQPVPEPRAPQVPDVHQGKPRLVLTRGAEAGQGFVLDKDVTTIGRAHSNDIVIDDITVSNWHAQVRARGDRHVLVDGGSLNGTYLNRIPVDSTELSENDEIWVGKARFVYRTT
ncbi:FHA domain-containing protein [Saccharopolyspora griseoalba]|uniref:FHA domain-containing protein n=1 Tax=Saccharopolyspora griseoalba TaxID=1431848 RepID=A0ABW2LP86_9PSEU